MHRNKYLRHKNISHEVLAHTSAVLETPRNLSVRSSEIDKVPNASTTSSTDAFGIAARCELFLRDLLNRQQIIRQERMHRRRMATMSDTQSVLRDAWMRSLICESFCCNLSRSARTCLVRRSYFDAVGGLKKYTNLFPYPKENSPGSLSATSRLLELAVNSCKYHGDKSKGSRAVCNGYMESATSQSDRRIR